jgi:N-acetyl-anhydromuramyl-L-alanine amidase AmpD
MDIGYHFVILTDGTIEIGRDVDAIGAHVAGHNEDTIGICMVGGVDAEGKSTNNFTKEQFDKLKKLLVELLLEYPKANVMGHRDFEGVKKDCPCFDAKDWFYNTNTRGYTTVVVERGDTLFFLARKYGTTVQDIVDMNNLISTNIKIGEILKIPA